MLQGYIVDFVCLEKKIIIEIDGGQHTKQEEYDAVRSRLFEGDGFTVYHFWNNEVFENLDDVLEMIYKKLGV